MIMDGFDAAQAAYDNALPVESPDVMGPNDGIDAIDTRMIDGIEHRVYLEHDSDCESPRDTDCAVGVIVTEHNSLCCWPVEDGDGYLSGGHVQRAIEDHDFRAVARWLRMFYGASTVLPLYSTGQDGRPSAGDVTDAPDAGDYVGVIFDQPSTRRVTGVAPADVAVALTVEMDEYSTWAVGDCYGYVIERAETGDSDPLAVDISDHNGWEHVDSCWGLIGEDYARTEAIRALSDQ
jgi:hypothetical protein